MLIDTKIVKRLNFQFCKSNAIYLLVDYMERKTEIQNMQQRIPFLIDFMEWQYVHDYRIINQDGLNEYLSYLYAKKTFNYAEAICSYIRSFCKYLMDEGYCCFVSFSEKPRRSNHQNNDDKTQSEMDSSYEEESSETGNEVNQNADENKDNTESETTDEEKPRKRRGRPRKSENKETNTTEDIKEEETANNGEKKRRGRPRKNKESQQQECEASNTETNNAEQETTVNNGEQKKRRGRPRKVKNNDEEPSVNKEAETTESECSKEQTSNDGEKKRRGRPRKEENGLKRITNYYEALGVQPDAGLDQIKKAYRKKAFKIHPDLHPDDPLAYKRIEALHSIMSVLEDRVQRMVYDVAFGYLEYDEDMRFESPEPITWYTKRHYTVWM